MINYNFRPNELRIELICSYFTFLDGRAALTLGYVIVLRRISDNGYITAPL